MSLSGETTAVLRLVAAPEISENITRIAIGSLVSHGWQSSWLSPLETPDRYYRDLHFRGPINKLTFDPGRKGEIIPLSKGIQLMKAFYHREASEETASTSK